MPGQSSVDDPPARCVRGRSTRFNVTDSTRMRQQFRGLVCVMPVSYAKGMFSLKTRVGRQFLSVLRRR